MTTIQQVAALSYCEQVALVDTVERFWASDVESGTGRLKQIGAIP